MQRLSLIFLLLFSFSLGQEMQLSLAKAEKLVLNQNFDLALAQKEVSKARISVGLAIGTVLPSISSYGSYTKNHELPVMYLPNFSNPSGPKIPITLGVPYNAVAGLTLNQPLFTGGAALNGFKIARASHNLSKFSRELASRNVTLAVRSLYFQIELLESLIQATDQSKLSAETNLEQVKSREKVGKASHFDVLQARVKYQSLLPQIQSLKNQHETALTNLRGFMGIEKPLKLIITDSLSKLNNPFQNASLDSLKQLALTRRPEVRMSQIQVDISRYQRNISVGQTLPTVSLSADVRHQAQSETSSGINRGNYVRSTTTTLNLSWPLFTGGRKALSIQKALISQKEAEINLQKLTLNIEAEVESAFLKIRESVLNIDANGSLRNQAAEALRLARIMYSNGSSTELEVLTAESNYLQAQSNYYQSIFQYNVAVDQLKKAVNTL